MIQLPSRLREQSPDTGPAFARVSELLSLLRSPEGCPWDRAQTLVSLRTAVLEEASELVDAIESGDAAHVMEELGDVYLVAGLMAQISADSGPGLAVADVLNLLSDKLIRRHPHVFTEGGESLDSAGAVKLQWDQIKEEVEGRGRDAVSALDRVGRHLPPLTRAHELQKKAAKTGFDWPDASGPLAKVQEELTELLETETEAEREHELGDLLFSVVNYARHIRVDPVVALHSANSRFERRFRHMEAGAGPGFSGLSLADQEALWQQAKRETQTTGNNSPRREDASQE